MRTTVEWKRELLLFTIIFLGLILAFFVAWNFRALWQNAMYDISDNDRPPVQEQILVVEGENAMSGEEVPTPVPTNDVSTAPPVTSSAEASMPAHTSQYILDIPKIGVHVPIAFPNDSDTDAVLESMERGVSLYPGSSLPGSAGRSVLLGHSSRASWYNGEYATVFSLLEKLNTLDEFYIEGPNGVKYTYIVFSKQFLSPDEANAILAGPSAPGEVDLVTCWPIGSASERTLIRAKLIGEES